MRGRETLSGVKLFPSKSEDCMDNEFKKFVNKLCRDQGGILNGRILKEIEVLQKQPSLSKETINALGLKKDLMREAVYEEFRTLRNAITFYLEGREYNKIPIYNPTKDGKKS